MSDTRYGQQHDYEPHEWGFGSQESRLRPKARNPDDESHIIPVVLNGDGIPIDVGRSKRLATATQRRALETIHTTCAIPECDTPYHHCQIHHIDYWENGGPTNLDNMVPLCTRHHHLAHEGRWTLSLNPTTRTVTFEPPST